VPHRVRIAVDGLKHDPALGRQLEARLVGAPGVREVDANPATGTILITYQDGWDWRDDPQTLASSLAANGSEGHVDALAIQLIASAADAAPRAGAGASFLLPLALGLLGGRGFLTLADIAVPRWYDVLWLGLGAYGLLGSAGVSTAEAAQDAVEMAASV
jgi:hypothetical protein